MKLLRIQDLQLVFPLSIVVGAGLAAIQPGPFSMGWVGFTVLLALALTVLIAAVRWSGGGRALAMMAAVALGLRLLAGTSLYLILPLDGYDEPDDRAGHVFTDAHRRDDQAWELASSKAPIWSAFDRRYYTDQYGGLLALSALTYKILSPDAHRQLLILALAALTASLGVPFFFRFAAKMMDAQLAAMATWLYCLYPESVLTGGAQMREPFLLTFIAVALWGFVEWLDGRHRSSWMWIAIGFGGLILVSPGIALALLILLGVWMRIRNQGVQKATQLLIVGSSLFLVAFLFLAWSLASRGSDGATPLGIIVNWFRDAVAWVIFELERGSGQVQNVFSKLSPAAQFGFVAAYGVSQPLLPPAFLEPTTVTWHVIGILRSIGWYIVLPLLVYSSVFVRRLASGMTRRVWTWLAAFNWIWILLCAVRAGGDQWDNPRYRLIFFGVQALVASAAWLSWRVHRDAWLPRILAAEILCLLLFGQWYLARYYLIGIHFPIMLVMAMCMGGVAIIMLGGMLWDRCHQNRLRD
jgi:hypothetical protein